jgi:S1-C subfamily serine protease
VGDVIASVNGQAVDDVGELRRRLREADGADVTIGVVRDRQSLTLTAKIERPTRQAGRRVWPV